MTFLELQQNVYENTGFSASSATTDVIARVRDWINQAHRHLLRQPGLQKYRRLTLSFDTVVGQKSYALKQAYADNGIEAIVCTSNIRRLVYRSRYWYRLQDPAENQSGTPYVWMQEGSWPVTQQPAATGLWAVSTAVGDTMNCHLEGIRANGDEQPVIQTALTGAVRVALGTITDYVKVLQFTLASAPAGSVSLYDAAVGGNEIARIPIGKTSIKYQVIRLWPTASGVLTYNVDGLAKLIDFANDDDIPWIPDDFHDLLAAYARMKEYDRVGDRRVASAMQEWNDGYARLMAMTNHPPDSFPVSGRLTGGRGLRWNNLGSYYPPEGIE